MLGTSDFAFSNMKLQSDPNGAPCLRKNLPLKGTNDTQAIESTFRAIKHYSKVAFGARIPTMHELIALIGVTI